MGVTSSTLSTLSLSTEVVMGVVSEDAPETSNYSNLLRHFEVLPVPMGGHDAALNRVKVLVEQRGLLDAFLVVDTLEKPVAQRFVQTLRGLPDGMVVQGGRRLRHLPLVVVSDILHPDGLPTHLRNTPIFPVLTPIDAVINAVDNALREYRTNILAEFRRVGLGFQFVAGGAQICGTFSPRNHKEAETTYLVLDHSSRVGLGVTYAHLLLVEDRAHCAGAAIAEFKMLLDDPRLGEPAFQRFFEHHPEFLFKEPLMEHWAHEPLENKETGKVGIPDFIVKSALVPHVPRSVEIIDLKKPTDKLLVGRSFHPRLSAAVNGVRGQLRDYQKYFNSEANDEEVRRTFGRVVRHPRLTAVIGRLPADEEMLARFEERLGEERLDVSITTYDEILMERAVKVAAHGKRVPNLTDEAE